MKKKESTEQIYTLKISLEDTKPAVWRRVTIPESATLYQLHVVIQEALGWTDSHLHQFDIDGKLYSLPEFDTEGEFEEVENEKEIALADILGSQKKKFSYEYDFGDSWTHQITVEKISPMTPETRYPTCLEGELACPPEDCGGVGGYYRLVEIMNDKKHPERAEMLEWLGGPFDPEYFDLDKVNESLRRVSRMMSQRKTS